MSLFVVGSELGNLQIAADGKICHNRGSQETISLGTATLILGGQKAIRINEEVQFR